VTFGRRATADWSLLAPSFWAITIRASVRAPLSQSVPLAHLGGTIRHAVSSDRIVYFDRSEDARLRQPLVADQNLPSSGIRAANATVTVGLRAFRPGDEGRVHRLLRELPATYPNGGLWLDRKVQDAKERKALITLAYLGNYLAGMAIETPKSRNARKLSTLFVPYWARRKGVGSTILKHCIDDWRRSRLRSVHLTMPLGRKDELAPMFALNGFRPAACAKDRYWQGHDELVMSWEPE
jgi:predicted GNAT family acetyltransferase